MHDKLDEPTDDNEDETMIGVMDVPAIAHSLLIVDEASDEPTADEEDDDEDKVMMSDCDSESRCLARAIKLLACLQ